MKMSTSENNFIILSLWISVITLWNPIFHCLPCHSSNKSTAQIVHCVKPKWKQWTQHNLIFIFYFYFVLYFIIWLHFSYFSSHFLQESRWVSQGDTYRFMYSIYIVCLLQNFPSSHETSLLTWYCVLVEYSSPCSLDCERISGFQGWSKTGIFLACLHMRFNVHLTFLTFSSIFSSNFI